jgi:hypothetical protein
MRKIILAFVFLLTAFSVANAQNKKDDIPVEQLPAEVKTVLLEYVAILTSSKTLDECAQNFIKVAGAGLVNEDGNSLRGNVQGFSLKKDYENIKFYANPVKITRVNVSRSSGAGFGPSALKGKVYKIWIAKADGGGGLPAPVSIIVPEGHATIKTPKVMNIGSF